MHNSQKDIGNYTIENYQIHDELSLSIAYEREVTLPASGGLRFLTYDNHQAQEADALALATGMAHKHLIYKTGFSGVKLVANGDVNPDNKKRLLDAVGDILNQKKGKIYVGCDMNITDSDMDYLYQHCPYILNTMKAKHISTSIAAAYGVYGSLKAVLDDSFYKKDKLSFVINGIGKIGAVLAAELVDAGHDVYTYDIDQERATVPGAMTVSGNDEWAEIPCDCLLLCSSSNIITDVNVKKLECRWIVSAANSPFLNDEVIAQLAKKHIGWVPDVVSNSGAVICDALEFYNTNCISTVPAESVYQYVDRCVYQKTMDLLSQSKQYHQLPGDTLAIFLALSQPRPPMG